MKHRSPAGTNSLPLAYMRCPDMRPGNHGPGAPCVEGEGSAIKCGECRAVVHI